MEDIIWYPQNGYMDFARGYNSRLHSPKLRPDEGRYSEFVTYEFGRMKKDKGYKDMNTTALDGGSAITGIFYFPNLLKKVIAVGSKLIYWNDTPTPMEYTDIKVSLSSDPSYYVSATPFYDSTLGNIAVFTNGKNDPLRWDGNPSNTAVVVNNAPKAKFVTAFDQRLIWGRLNEGNASDDYMIEWSALDDGEDYSSPGSGQQPFMEGGTKITGLQPFKDGVIVFKEDSIWLLSRTGDAKSPFRRERIKADIGCDAPYSIAHCEGITYFVYKTTLYKTDGYEYVPLSDRTKDILFGVKPINREKIYGAFSPDYKEYWLLLDYHAESTKRKILIYNIEQDTFKVRDCPANVVSAIKLAAFSTWNRIDLSWNEMWDYTWVDPRLYADFNHFITGDYNGKLQRHYWSDQKNGEVLEGWHITKWFNFEELGVADRYKRINALSFLTDKMVRGSFQVYYMGSEQAIPRTGLNDENWTLAGTFDNTSDRAELYFQTKAYKNFCFKIGNATDKTPFSIQGWRIGFELLGHNGF